jgi:hypothetical protein
MDLRGYYKKIKDLESAIEEPYTMVVSLPTPEGGKAGQRTEVSRALAAKMITDGLARLATSTERQEGERKPHAAPAASKVR